MLLLRNLRGKYVAVTGACWITRGELARKLSRRGAHLTPDGRVNLQTSVLVRGRSGNWKYGEFGLKEEAAAARIRAGHIISVVEDYEFQKLVELGKPARCSDYVAGQPLDWLGPAPSSQSFEKIAKIEGPLDREFTAKGRTEQAYLRALLFRGKGVCSCSICGTSLPTDLLIAGHIKPRSACTHAERRDAHNITFAVCLFGCDALYERGFISVDWRGRVVTATIHRPPGTLQRRLRQLKGRNCSAWRDESASYFTWHYERRFRG
jgi:hypothetical protein